MKKLYKYVFCLALVSLISAGQLSSKGLCDGPGGGLLCGAGIGGGIGSAIDGDDGAKAGAIIGGIMGIASSINEAESRNTNESLNYNNEVISDNYPALLVYNTQIALISIGYYVGMYDGTFTRSTSEAIKSYQKDNSLIINGIPTEELYERIRRDIIKIYSKE
tara:strand:+ start:3885 stop:4373 length:489 start_codon:yes stop_codon:yes gene_type:complete